MNLVGKLITIRAVEEGDLDKLHAWSNDPDTWHQLTGWHFPYSRKSTREWFAGLDARNPGHQTLALEATDAGLIGTVNLYDIDWKNRNAKISIMIGERNSRNKGYARDAMMIMQRYVFLELGLNHLGGEVIAANRASILFHMQQCGYKKEGVKEEFLYKNGRFHDCVLLGMTRSRYLDFIQNNPYWD